MTAGEISIVPYDPTLWEALDSFWQVVLGKQWNETARERWRWLNARRAHFVAHDGERVVGNATLLRQPFVSGDGKSFVVGWITDFFVLPDLKGQGLGKRLTLRLMDDGLPVASFGQSPDARRCFGRLGWTTPEWIPLAARAIPQVARARRSPFHIEECSFEDARLDSIWARRGQAGALGARDTSALAERFNGRPDAEYHIFVAEEAGEPRGWIIVRRIADRWNRRFGPVPVGLVVDLLAADHDPRVLDALVAYATRWLGRSGALVVLAVSTQGPAGDSLARHGFAPELGVGFLRLRHLPRKGFTASGAADEALRTVPPLSFLDCDAELSF